MPNYTNLENILEMDFTALRGLSCETANDCRATDTAIETLVDNLHEFFSQFNDDNESIKQDTLTKYERFMKEITRRINIAEYNYYLKKYTINYPDNAKEMAETTKLKDFTRIPKRMQFWAARFEYGSSIRNPVKHNSVIKNMNRWSNKVTEKNGILGKKSNIQSQGKYRSRLFACKEIYLIKANQVVFIQSPSAINVSEHYGI